ncbi:MAG: nucleotide-binding protein [Ruminococcus sp.]|nr:nucleotide-binding protein [Ruminococcus sp.]
MLRQRFKQYDNNNQNDKKLELRSILGELKQKGLIITQWSANVPYDIVINNSARTYFEMEPEYERSNSDNIIPTSNNRIQKKIFIVHGHDDTMKFAVKDVITSLKLTPIILHEQPNKGRTIIEKFEQLSEDVGFAIVLLSADDEMKDGKFRARQNVILELGYFVAKLGRDRVVALYDTSKEVDIPSDISGVLYEPYDNPNGAWKNEIVQELKAAGYNVSADDLIKV